MSKFFDKEAPKELGANWDAFRQELEVLINKHSIDNECEIPDWILATYLTSSVKQFAAAVKAREKWFNKD